MLIYRATIYSYDGKAIRLGASQPGQIVVKNVPCLFRDQTIPLSDVYSAIGSLSPSLSDEHFLTPLNYFSQAISSLRQMENRFMMAVYPLIRDALSNYLVLLLNGVEN